jgi:hypothetical protein
VGSIQTAFIGPEGFGDGFTIGAGAGFGVGAGEGSGFVDDVAGGFEAGVCVAAGVEHATTNIKVSNAIPIIIFFTILMFLYPPFVNESLIK